MRQRTFRIASLVAASALLLSACGSSGDDDTLPLPGDSADQSDGQAVLRAPTPIRIAEGGSAGGLGRSVASDAAVPAIAPFGGYEYEVDEALPSLPTDDTGYVFDGTPQPTVDDVRRLADAFGVAGEVVETDDGYQRSWRVGPDDGSAPSLVVYADSTVSWSYNGPWGELVSVDCAVAVEPVSPPVEPAEPEIEPEPDAATEGIRSPRTVEPEPVRPFECDTPEPPVGVPTEAEAEAEAAELLTALGIDVASVRFETYADDWFAGVTAIDVADPRGQVRSWSFGFGGAGVLHNAGGSLAAPVPVGPYSLVDLDTAIARLNDNGGWFVYGGPVGDPRLATGAAAEPAIAEASPPPADLAPDQLPPDTAPVPDAEPIVVTLVDLTADLWWVWDVDGRAWLLPAYRFTDTDGGWHTVPAVTDEFLVVDDPVPVDPVPGEPGEPGTPDPTDAIPVEPGDGIGDGAVPLPEFDLPGVDDPRVEALVGLPLDDFAAEVEALGLGPVRIAVDNGEPLALTADLVAGRVNVAIVAEIVVDAAVEALDEVPGEPVSPEALVTGVYEGVEFYPACGDETLLHEGVTWYQIQRSEYPEEYARAVDSYRENVPEGVGPRGVVRVAEPGPGDDIGTLVVWDDGIAYFVTDSGDLSAWLTTTELTYPWTC